MRCGSFFLAAGAVLLLAPCGAAAKRTPWNADEVSALGSRLAEQTQRLEEAVRATSKAAEAATEDPDREVGAGVRTMVIADLEILGSRTQAYVGAVESGLGREETRSLFGRIDSLVRLAAGDVRRLPDLAKYRADLEALEETVATLAGFYAEELDVTTPPDPLVEMNSPGS